MKQKTYYILAINYGDGYGVEFGAYDRLDVIEEQICFKTLNSFQYATQYKSKVIKTTLALKESHLAE